MEEFSGDDVMNFDVAELSAHECGGKEGIMNQLQTFSSILVTVVSLSTTYSLVVSEKLKPSRFELNDVLDTDDTCM